MPENDDRIVGKIKESLDFLDSSVEVGKPDFLELIRLVNETEEKKERKGNRQFAGFLVAALFIVIAEVFAFSSSQTVFAVVQAAAVAFIIPALMIWTKNVNRVCGK